MTLIIVACVVLVVVGAVVKNRSDRREFARRMAQSDAIVAQNREWRKAHGF